MKLMKIARSMLLLLAVMSVMAQGALAVDKKTSAQPEEPKYRQLTGEVVSMNASSIMIRSKSKGDISFIITPRTNMSDAKAVKPGDRARVNYKEHRTEKTATKIVKLAAKASGAPAAPKTGR